MVTAKPFRASDVPQSALAELHKVCGDNLHKPISAVGQLLIDAYKILNEFYGVKAPEIVVIQSEEAFNKLCKSTKRIYLKKYPAWYDHDKIIVNLLLLMSKTRVIRNSEFYTAFHEYRHHMQSIFPVIGKGRTLFRNNGDGTRSFNGNETRFIEADAYQWARNLLKRVNRLPRLRKQKLDADRRCRERYPERYGKKQ